MSGSSDSYQGAVTQPYGRVKVCYRYLADHMPTNIPVEWEITPTLLRWHPVQVFHPSCGKLALVSVVLPCPAVVRGWMPEKSPSHIWFCLLVYTYHHRVQLARTSSFQIEYLVFPCCQEKCVWQNCNCMIWSCIEISSINALFPQLKILYWPFRGIVPPIPTLFIVLNDLLKYILQYHLNAMSWVAIPFLWPRNLFGWFE